MFDSPEHALSALSHVGYFTDQKTATTVYLAEQIPEQFIAANAERVVLVINVSGGKDSIRMLGYLRSRFPQFPAYYVMADTGFEHVHPVPAVEWSRQIAARLGSTLEVVRNANKTYLQMVRARGKFPSAQFRQCTSDFKRSPIQKLIRRLPYQVLINGMGWDCAPRSRLSVRDRSRGHKMKR